MTTHSSAGGKYYFYINKYFAVNHHYLSRLSGL